MDGNCNLKVKDYVMEFFTNTASASIQLIPIIGGSLNQMTFGYMSSLQAKRTKNYLVKLSEYLQSDAIQREVLDQVNEYLNSDDGREFFYLNLEKVAKTRCEKKLILLKNMLLNQLAGNKTFSLDTAEEFLNILDNIKFESVQVLEFLANCKETNPKNRNIIDAGSLDEDIEETKKSEYLAQLKMKYKLLDDELNYFHQQLITNGLAVDNSMGYIGGKPLERFRVTKMGELFLGYVLEGKL